MRDEDDVRFKVRRGTDRRAETVTARISEKALDDALHALEVLKDA